MNIEQIGKRQDLTQLTFQAYQNGLFIGSIIKGIGKATNHDVQGHIAGGFADLYAYNCRVNFRL